MNDKELADRVVALGYEFERDGHSYGIPRTDTLSKWLTAHVFVRDWRVAGALMEQCGDLSIINTGDEWLVSVADVPENIEHHDDSLPRAIISACVEALEAK